MESSAWIPPSGCATGEPDARGESGTRQVSVLDVRLSVNGQQSCANTGSWHYDGLARAKGTTGELHPRSSMSLVNVAYVPSLTWANPAMDELEEQALVPMFGTDPVELGLKGQEERVLDSLRKVEVYQRLFSAAFPGDPRPIRMDTIARPSPRFNEQLSRQGLLTTGIATVAMNRHCRSGEAGREAILLGRKRDVLNATGAGAVAPSVRGRTKVESNSITPDFTTPIARLIPGSRSIPGRRGFRKIPCTDAAEHCRNRSLHARREHCDAIRGD